MYTHTHNMVGFQLKYQKNVPALKDSSSLQLHSVANHLRPIKRHYIISAYTGQSICQSTREATDMGGERQRILVFMVQLLDRCT